MQFLLVSILTMFSTTVSGSPTSLETAVKAPTPDFPSTITFCTLDVGCDYPALPITPGACVDFNDYLANAVRAAMVPGGYVCTLFLIPSCTYKGHSIFGKLNPVVETIPDPFYENTNSFRCSPF